MGKASESFKKRIEAALAKHGAIGEFIEKTGLSRTAVQGWLMKGAAPSLDNIEKAAEALGTTAWDLIKPDDAESISLSQEERQIIERFRAMTIESRRAVVHVVNGFYADDQEGDRK